MTDFEKVWNFENLYRAYRKARRGKRWKGAAAKFEVNLLEALHLLSVQLRAKTYRLSPYNTFKVYEPKERIVGYSPAAALASIEIEGKEFSTSICVGTFYNYITKGVFLRLTNADLPEKPKRKRPYRTVKTVKRAPKGESIEKRPAEVDARKDVGHWEMDTVYSKKKSSKKTLLVLTERKSRLPIMELMPDRTAESVVAALDRIERRFGSRLFRLIFRTITVDNGGEFADVERLERSVLTKGKRTKVYYCHPYSSYERGSNENENKIIRRHFPKGTDFGKVTAAEVKRAESWIANYPRKILGWKTSEMLFREAVAAL